MNAAPSPGGVLHCGTPFVYLGHKCEAMKPTRYLVRLPDDSWALQVATKAAEPNDPYKVTQITTLRGAARSWMYNTALAIANRNHGVLVADRAAVTHHGTTCQVERDESKPREWLEHYQTKPQR